MRCWHWLFGLAACLFLRGTCRWYYTDDIGHRTFNLWNAAFGKRGIFVKTLVLNKALLQIMCMVESSRRNMVGYMTFPQTMKYALSVGPKSCQCTSKFAGHLVNGILMFSHYGVCVVYIVFVSVNVKQVVDYYLSELDIRLSCAIVGILSIPLFLLRQLKYLVPTNMIANVLMYTGFACILYYYFRGLPPIDTMVIFNHQLPLFLGILLFATSSVGVVSNCQIYIY